MIKYKAAGQLSIEEFQTPFQAKLDKQNRWVKLSAIIPWDRLARILVPAGSVEDDPDAIRAMSKSTKIF